MSHRKLSLLLLTLLIISFLFSCSKKDSPLGPDPKDINVQQITVTPLSGTPGQAITVTGFQFDSTRIDEYEVMFVDNRSPVRNIGSSTAELGIPLFLDTSIAWSVVPTDSITVDVYLNDTLVAQSNKIKIDSLPHATGTTAEVKLIMDSVIVNFQSVFNEIPVTYSWETELRDSLFAIVQQLISGPDSSIAAILDGTSSMINGVQVDMELTDAILHSSGTADYWREFLSAFSVSTKKLHQNIHDLKTSGILCNGTGDDMDLACKMQIYVLIRDYSEVYLGETRETWEYSIGLVADIVSLYPPASGYPPVAAAKIVSSILAITDIVIENVVLSILPSQITSFNIVLDSDSLGVNEFTNSQIFISAVNSPDSLTINEMVDLVMSIIGLRDAPQVEDMELIVLNMIQFVVDKFRSFYTYLSFIEPDIFNPNQVSDGTWYGFPDIYWNNIEITHYELVRLYSENPDIMEPDSLVFEWWSANCGETNIDARTRAAGVTSTVVNANALCFPCEYSGGAFGEESAITTARTIKVGESISMEINISGLPAEDSADVLVIYPDGSTFEHFGQSGVLNNIDAGSYEIQAHERTGSDGVVYVVDPETRTVEVTCDSTTVVNIEYVQKYGSLYIVFTGLYHGEEGEVPGDVRIEGPNNYVREIQWSENIDSLEPGTYDIFAFEVSDNWGQDYVPDSSYVSLEVERNNTTTHIVTYKEKYAKLTINVAFLPDGAVGDVDITGPDGFSRHVTETERIDSLLEGEYVVTANNIIDPVSGETIEPSPKSESISLVGGDEETIRIDYSGGKELTITFDGLPTGAPANLNITGPESYSATVTTDTTLKGLPSGGPYNITMDTVNFNGRDYYPITTDTSLNITSDKTLSFRYETKAIMSIYLGSLRDTTNVDDEKGQMIIRAISTTRDTDTTITDEKYEPQLGTLPQQISLDTCGFEDGRLLLNGITTYTVQTSTSTADADIELSFDVSDTMAIISFDGYFRTLPPPDPGGLSNARIEVYLQNLLRVEVYNPNEGSGSYSGASSTALFEISENPGPAGSGNGGINWYDRRHKCNEPWSPVYYVWNDYYGPGIGIDYSDSTQTIGGMMGGLTVYGGESSEQEMGFTFNLGSYLYPVQVGEIREATVHGEIIIALRQGNVK